MADEGACCRGCGGRVGQYFQVAPKQKMKYNLARFKPNDPEWERKLMFQVSVDSSTSNSLIYYDAQVIRLL